MCIKAKIISFWSYLFLNNQRKKINCELNNIFSANSIFKFMIQTQVPNFVYK